MVTVWRPFYHKHNTTSLRNQAAHMITGIKCGNIGITFKTHRLITAGAVEKANGRGDTLETRTLPEHRDTICIACGGDDCWSRHY